MFNVFALYIKFFQSAQIRLVDENKTLAIERSRLSDLIANIQKMHNDVERFGENDKRRLETQVQMLEAQVYAYVLSSVVVPYLVIPVRNYGLSCCESRIWVVKTHYKRTLRHAICGCALIGWYGYHH